MAAVNLRDFKDIQDAVLEQLKYQSSDTVSRSRIKRDINMVYDQVLMFSKWWWLKGNVIGQIEPFFNTGTVSVTEDSTSITFSTSVVESKVDHYLNISGQREVYRITAHTAGATSATIDAAYTQNTNSAVGFKTWDPIIDLPTDCRELEIVWTDHLNEPLKPRGPDKLRELMANTGWIEQGRPRFYSVLD